MSWIRIKIRWSLWIGHWWEKHEYWKKAMVAVKCNIPNFIEHFWQIGREPLCEEKKRESFGGNVSTCKREISWSFASIQCEIYELKIAIQILKWKRTNSGGNESDKRLNLIQVWLREMKQVQNCRVIDQWQSICISKTGELRK